MNSELGVAIRQRLVAARKKAGLSQEQVAQRLEPPVSRQTISRWETGAVASPNPVETAQLCTIYGVTTDEVLRGVPSFAATGSSMVDRVLRAPTLDASLGHRDFANSEK